jgi:hypothetical protein
MLVTSRIVGYREVQLTGAFSQFVISPFDDDEIGRFAQSWYQALGAPESAAELVKTIQDNPSIRRLVEVWQREGDRVLRPLLHDTRRTEIILLAAGHCAEFSQYQATQFVRSIRRQPQCRESASPLCWPTQSACG